MSHHAGDLPFKAISRNQGHAPSVWIFLVVRQIKQLVRSDANDIVGTRQIEVRIMLQHEVSQMYPYVFYRRDRGLECGVWLLVPFRTTLRLPQPDACQYQRHGHSLSLKSGLSVDSISQAMIAIA